MSNMQQKPGGLCGGNPLIQTQGRGVALCLGGEVCDEHISVVQAALHGEEMLDCNVYVGDVCSGRSDVENPSRLRQKIWMRTPKLAGDL